MTAPIIFAFGTLLLLTGVLYLLVARPRINQWGATDREHQATWPGDQLVAQPSFVWTNAITIHTPAAQIWPWLVQLGQGRGGLYSYDWLENLIGCDVHSTDRIRPQFQTSLQLGDRLIRMARYAPCNPVALFEPQRALVLGHVKDTSAELAARARAQQLGVSPPASRPGLDPAAYPLPRQLADGPPAGPGAVRDAAQDDARHQAACGSQVRRRPSARA
jgi:hypothetical protein